MQKTGQRPKATLGTVECSRSAEGDFASLGVTSWHPGRVTCPAMRFDLVPACVASWRLEGNDASHRDRASSQRSMTAVVRGTPARNVSRSTAAALSSRRLDNLARENGRHGSSLNHRYSQARLTRGWRNSRGSKILWLGEHGPHRLILVPSLRPRSVFDDFRCPTGDDPSDFLAIDKSRVPPLPCPRRYA